jgi:uncharacterized protein YndB with AHSA1/START domain
MKDIQFTVESDKKTLIAKKSFPAPKEKLWQAFSDPALLAQWWAPRGWETKIKHMDFTNEGYWHYGMKCTDSEQKNWFGKISWGRAVFHNIEPMSSFEYTDQFSDEAGNINTSLPASHTKVIFSEANGTTTVSSKTTYNSEKDLSLVLNMGVQEGLTQTWVKLSKIVSA